MLLCGECKSDNPLRAITRCSECGVATCALHTWKAAGLNHLCLKHAEEREANERESKSLGT